MNGALFATLSYFWRYLASQFRFYGYFVQGVTVVWLRSAGLTRRVQYSTPCRPKRNRAVNGQSQATERGATANDANNAVR